MTSHSLRIYIFQSFSSASEAEPLALSVVTTVDDNKIQTRLLKCKESKDFMDTGKEDNHFEKCDKFGQCFMASMLCAGI